MKQGPCVGLFFIPFLIAGPIAVFAEAPPPSAPASPLLVTPPGSFSTLPPADVPTTEPAAPFEPGPLPPLGIIPSVIAPPVAPGPGTAEFAPTGRFELHPAIGVFEHYTDNFFLTTRHKQQDFRTAVSPTLLALINEAFAKGTVTATVTEAHDSATDSFSTFYSLNGLVVWLATPRWSLSLSDTLSRSDEASVADRLGLRQQRRTFIANVFKLSSLYSLGRISAEQHYTLSTFFDQGGPDTTSQTVGGSVSARFLQGNTGTIGYDYLASTTSGHGFDITSHHVSASLARELSRTASAGVAGNYLIAQTTTGPGGGLPATNDFQIWTGSLFTSHSLPGRWTMQGNIGYTRLVPSRGRELGGLFTLSSLLYQFGRATATASVDQGFSPTYGYGQNSGVVRTFGVTAALSAPLTPRVAGAINGFYRESQLTGVGSSLTGETTTWGGTFSLSAQLTRWLSASVGYSYRVFTRLSTTDGSKKEVPENRIRATFTASF